MDNQLRNDLNEMRTLLTCALNNGLEYLEKIDEVPTSVKPGTSTEVVLEKLPKGSNAALQEFNERFKHLMLASTGPRYWGFVTGGGLFRIHRASPA